MRKRQSTTGLSVSSGVRLDELGKATKELEGSVEFAVFEESSQFE